MYSTPAYENANPQKPNCRHRIRVFASAFYRSLKVAVSYYTGCTSPEQTYLAKKLVHIKCDP